MLNRSILTAIIGFLVGCLLYYIADAEVVIVLVMGVSGYFFGLFLDNSDSKHQFDHFSTLSSSEEVFQPTYLPEALIFYSKKENLTTISIDFQVETKPQTFRLSVLKNLQDHQFRILEDSNKTIFSLTLDFPECNYPKIVDSPDLMEEFHYNIQERSLDFQNAVQKIVPGLVLSNFAYPEFFGDESFQDYLGRVSSRPSQSHPPTSTSNNGYSQPLNGSEREISRTAHDLEETKIISESQIMEDLLTETSKDSKLPNLSPYEAQQLKDSNQRQLETFLNENDTSEVLEEEVSNDTLGGNETEIDNEIKIDFSKVDQPMDSSTQEDFEQNIINQIEERTRIALNKVAPDLGLQEEQKKVKKYISES
ncbi:MAG: hypothetical protein ACFFFH_04995 [Candidatus Thorarchaeota archaeon]